jgi:hypothetical protein
MVFCNRTKFIIHVQPKDAIVYSEKIDPVPENYIPNEWDAKRELMSCAQHILIICFCREANILEFSLADFK